MSHRRKRGSRPPLLIAVVVSTVLAVPAAHAATYHYDVTIDVTGATQTWTRKVPGVLDSSGNGQASWHGVWNVAIGVNRAAQTAAGGSADQLERTGTATGGFSVDDFVEPPYSCQYSVGQPAFSVLFGSGLDAGRVGTVAGADFSYRKSGLFGLALVSRDFGESLFSASCSPGIVPPVVVPYSFVGIKTFSSESGADCSSAGTPIQFPAARLGEERITFSAPFSGLSPCTVGYQGTVQGTYKVDLRRVCPIGEVPPPRFGLDSFEASEVTADQQVFLQRYIAELRRAIAAVERDERLHPEHRARDEATLKRLRALLAGATHAGERALASHTQLTPDESKLLDRATCGLLDAAKESLTDYVKEHGTKNQQNALAFVDKLGTLKDVLDGHVAPTSPEAKKLLESNLIALGERLGGADAGKLTGKGVTLYKVLSGSLSQKELNSTLRTQIQDLTSRLAGKNAGELVKQVLSLRDVIVGNADETEQFEVLKESVVGLATRLLGEGVLDTPHVRAAMLGFELGRPFGQRIAADLKLIGRIVLVRECRLVLAKQQGVGPGEVNYGEKTQTVIPVHNKPSDPAFEFQGWICKIRPEGHVGGVEGGVVEAISPVKRYVFGLITLGGESVFFDPQFAS